MARISVIQWADTFRESLGDNKYRIPFDRVARCGLSEISALIEMGYSYSTLSNALADAGVTRPNGAKYSPDQIYTAVQRALRADQPRPPISSSDELPSAEIPAASQKVTTPDRSEIGSSSEVVFAPINAGNDETNSDEANNELSMVEIQAALYRLRRN